MLYVLFFEPTFRSNFQVYVGVVKLSTIDVLALTLGKETPSSRFRVRKLINDLSLCGVNVTEHYAKYGGYPPAGLFNRLKWLPKTALNSYTRVTKADKYDVTWIQKPLISTLYSFERFCKSPMVFDVDDAVHLRGENCKKIAIKSEHVICGNEFLAEYYAKYSNVSIIPTAVDTDYFLPATNKLSNDIIVGWSGSSSGFKFLYDIEEQLLVLVHKFPELIIKIVSNQKPDFKLLPEKNVQYVRWSPENEVTEIQNFTVGLMPLSDTPWSRGKCSYKMLTYMSAGIPVVVSGVGMNIEIMNHGQCGLLMKKNEEWAEAIESVILSRELQINMGNIGREIVCDHYSNKVIAPKLAKVLKGFV